MNTKNKLLLKKSLAIFTIYLIISLTFFTAKAFAAINYEISGDKKVSHFARRTNDNILLNTTSESNVSFISNTNTLIPLSCVNNSDGIIQCIRSFPSSDISNNVINPVFKLQQISDTQTIIKAQLHIDNTSPQINAFEVQRVTDGLNFVYDFTDYLANISENIDGTTCIGSGIGTISLIIPQNTAYNKIITIPTQNCTVSGNYFVNFSNSNTKMDVDKIDYILTLTDRVGNVNVLKGNVSGDFKAPEITNTYKIMQGNTELTKFSQIGGLKANVQVTIEDSNLDKDNVYADLSNLNSALKTAYTRMKAECITDSQNKVYTCVFKDIELRPLSTDASIVVSAIDTSGNIAIKTLPKNIELSTGAGQLLYIGPLKNHCTNDLTKCYVTSGKQIFTAELSSESNYNHSLIYIGINSETRFAACNLNNTWKCIGTYDIPKGTVDLNVFLAESYDDYGNPLNSPITNRLLIDDIKPKNLTKLEVINSNNNIDCAVYGDELTFNVKVQEETTEPKIYVDTSKFTTQDIQNGVCNLGENGNWDCTLTIKDFISTATTAPITENIIIEDLAGNKLPIPYNFSTCQATTAAKPNVIFGITQLETPNIDRRTASLIPIKTYIPLSFKVTPGATIMYLSLDSCTGYDMNKMSALGDSYFIQNGDSFTLVTTIGGDKKLLPDKEFNFNCTVSAKIKQKSTVFTIPEKEIITLSVNTFNQPATLDSAIAQEIISQKETLRNIDKDIAKRKEFDNILKQICNMADIIVKVDAVLQTVKSLTYFVLAAIEATGIFAPFAETTWKAIEPPLSTVDRIVQTFVWPTGIDPKAAIGYGVKYTCIIYNCKFYTLSGLLEIGSDAVKGYNAIKANSNNNALLEGTKPLVDKTPEGGEKTTTAYKDGRVVTEITDSKGKLISSSTGKTNVEDGTTKITENNYKDGKLISSTEKTITNGLISVPGHVIAGTDIDTSTLQQGVVSTETKTTNFETNKVLVETTNANNVKTQYELSLKSTDVKVPVIGISTGIKKTTLTPDANAQTNNVQKTIDYSYKGKVYSNIDDASAPTLSSVATQTEKSQELLYSSIDRQDWIINPYRSKHYDGLCAPATLYNLQKERQIRCMYLSCLQTSYSTGASSVVCKDIYNFYDCLYLDSAQWKLNNNIWSQITKGIVRDAIMTAMGYGLQLGFNKACAEYMYNPVSGVTIFTGWKSALCGAGSVLLKGRETLALLTTPGQVLKDLFKGNSVDDPAKVNDYCNGGALYAN